MTSLGTENVPAPHAYPWHLISLHGSVLVEKVPDGHTLEVQDKEGNKRALYSMDRMKNHQWVLYRMDKKPTLRSHRVVDTGDVQSWVRENLQNLFKEAGV